MKNFLSLGGSIPFSCFQKKKKKKKKNKKKKTKKRNLKVNKLNKKKTMKKGGKVLKKRCKCDKKRKFKGTEPSPKGLGYCAHCSNKNIVMEGKDGNLWRNTTYSKGLRWVKI